MIDFKVVQARVALPVTAVAPIRDFLPLSILVMGNRLNLTEEVIYNDVVADEFYAQSDTRLIVRIPKSQLGRNFETVRVLSSAQLTRSDAMVTLGVTRPFRTVAGIDRLVQSWLMLFMSTPGSDAFSQDSGGGGRNIIGSSSDKSERSATTALVTAVDRTRSELIRLQSFNPRIPPDERLLSANMLSATFEPQTTTISAVVGIQNSVGDSAEVSLR